MDERALLNIAKDLGYKFQRRVLNENKRPEHDEEFSRYYVSIGRELEIVFPFYFINDHDMRRPGVTS